MLTSRIQQRPEWTDVLDRSRDPVRAAAPSFSELPARLRAVIQSLQSGVEHEAQTALEHLQALRLAWCAEASPYRRPPWERLDVGAWIRQGVGLWVAAVCALDHPHLRRWVSHELHGELHRWDALFEQGMDYGWEATDLAKRPARLVELSAHLQDELEEVLRRAAAVQGQSLELARDDLEVVVGALGFFQTVMRVTRERIKQLCGAQERDVPFSDHRLRRMALHVGTGFVGLLLLRLSAVIVGGVALAHPTDSEEGWSGLSLTRFGLNTLNLGATFLYERLCRRREDALLLHSALTAERASLKKALFEARDWYAALTTLLALERVEVGEGLMTPANLEAGFHAMERLQHRSSSAEEAQGAADEEAGLQQGLQATRFAMTAHPPIAFDVTSWEHLERHLAALGAECGARLASMRGAMQACARTCEGLADAHPSTLSGLGHHLHQRVIDLGFDVASAESSLSEAVHLQQRLLAHLETGVCRGESSYANRVTSVVDLGFAATSWLMGGVEAFAPLQAAAATQVLLGGAILDTINSGTAPLRQAAQDRSKTLQQIRLRLQEIITSLEGILPLAKAAAQAFGHIAGALLTRAEALQEQQDHTARVHHLACELARITLLMGNSDPQDPPDLELQQRAQDLAGLLAQMQLASGGQSGLEPAWSNGPQELACHRREELEVTAALAQAALLPQEERSQLGRAMPSLKAQLLRAAQQAEQGLQRARQPQGLLTAGPNGSPEGRSASAHEVSVAFSLSDSTGLASEGLTSLSCEGGTPSLHSTGSAAAGVDWEEADQQLQGRDAGRPWAPVELSDLEHSPVNAGGSEAGPSRRVVEAHRPLSQSPAAVELRRAIARTRWGALRNNLKRIAAECYLSSGQWRRAGSSEQRGVRLWRVMRAAVVLSAFRMLQYRSRPSMQTLSPSKSGLVARSPKRR
jgi:hypothetical protein